MNVRLLRTTVLMGGTMAIVASCANIPGIAPGTPIAAVQATAGKPFRVWPELNGGASWEYPQGPEGRFTFMVRVGYDDRVARIDQVLGWDTFKLVVPGMPMTEVEHLLGRPYSREPSRPTDETVWSWRFMETVWPRCFYTYESKDGKVTHTGVRDKSPGTLGVGLEIPC